MSQSLSQTTDAKDELAAELENFTSELPTSPTTMALQAETAAAAQAGAGAGDAAASATAAELHGRLLAEQRARQAAGVLSPSSSVLSPLSAGSVASAGDIDVADGVGALVHSEEPSHSRSPQPELDVDEPHSPSDD